MGAPIAGYTLCSDRPQYHPPEADKSAGATGQGTQRNDALKLGKKALSD